MKNTAIFKKISDENIIYLLFGSLFLPFYLTALILIFSLVYIFKTQKIEDTMERNSGVWMICFFLYTLLVGIFNLNFIGVACSFAFIAIVIVGKFIRKYITLDTFENALDITCVMAAITSFICATDFVYHQFLLEHKSFYRCTLYFFNSNYLATLFATVIIICGYKVLNHKRKPIYYYFLAFICAIGAFLTGSMFVWVEVFIGCSAILLLSKRHQLLSALFLLAGTFIIVLYCIPNIIPRLNESNITTDNRVIIWKTTLNAIWDSTPIFGKGFLTYFHIKGNYPGSYNTAHSHSILLEPFLSFGIIGTIFITIYFFNFFKRVRKCRNAQHIVNISSLILALSFAILVHSTTDLTFMWLQTGLFYCLIFASIGIEERFLKIEK